MKLSAMGTKDRRALLIGAVVTIPSLMVPYVITPYFHTLAAVRDQTADERDHLAREQRAIAALPKMPATRAHAADQLARELPRLFQNNDELVATGDLGQYVAGVADKSGIRLQQSETRPAQNVATGVHALQVEIRAEGDLDGLLHFLQQLETGPKLVRVGVVAIEGGGRVPHDLSRRPAQSMQSGGVAENVQSDAQGSVQSSVQSSVLGGILSNIPNGMQNVVVQGGDAQDLLRRLQRFQRQQRTQQRVQQRVQQRSGDGSSNNSANTEVLSLSASVYGYRLSGPSQLATDAPSGGALSPFSRPPYDFESIDAIVAHDLFSPTRTPPAVSYRVAMSGNGSAAPVAASPPVQSPPPPPLALLGTVLGNGQRDFAMLQNGTAAAQVARVGDNIAGYTLKSIRPGMAVFAAPDGSPFTVQASEPGDQSVERGTRRRRRRGQNGQPDQPDQPGQQSPDQPGQPEQPQSPDQPSQNVNTQVDGATFQRILSGTVTPQDLQQIFQLPRNNP